MSCEDHLLTVRDVADIFQVSTRTVYEKLRTGSWPHRQAEKGHGIRFTVEHVETIKRLGERQQAKSKGRIRDLYARKAA